MTPKDIEDIIHSLHDLVFYNQNVLTPGEKWVLNHSIEALNEYRGILLKEVPHV